MSFKRNNRTVLPSEWFSANVEYEGQGYAELIKPQGTMEVVEGNVKIRFDEFGGSIVEMELKNQEEHVKLKSREYNIACRKLTVTTLEGIFSTSEILSCHSRYEEERIYLNFKLLRSHFEVTDSRAPKYWVLPLSNFLSKFILNYPDLDHHPLRIYSRPTLPDNLLRTLIEPDVPLEAVETIIDANYENQLIYFKFNGSLGFIEPLADYSERYDKLIKGRERYLITTVMVGEVGTNSIDFAHLGQWFPFDFLLLLGLATGTEVTAPWIEFRDEQGKLIQRIHINLGRPCFSEGDFSMREDMDLNHDSSGIGYLLTCSQLSPDYGKPHLRSALEHVVQSGLYSLTLEQRLSHVCQALDGLCKEYGLDVQNLLETLDPKTLDPETLDPETLDSNSKLRHIVKETLSFAVDEIKKAAENVATSAATPLPPDWRQSKQGTLDRIAQRVTSAIQKDKAFGLAIVGLLKQFNLPDADIIDAHYRANPRSNRTETWDGIVSKYRNELIHRGYFNFDEGEYNLEDALRITQHLRDILLRILFTLLGYNGNYFPTIANMTLQPNSTNSNECSVLRSFNSPMPVNWVSRELPASELGY